MSPRLLASSSDVRAAFLAHGCMRRELVDLIPAANASFSPDAWPFRGQWEQFALAGQGGGYFPFLSTAKTQLRGAHAAGRGQMLLVDGFNMDLLPSHTR